MKYLKILIIVLTLFLTMSAVSSHGVDITSDTMVVANETNGKMTKSIADSNNMNISVYKFTSEDEILHTLEHSINNTNKRILFVAYQDIAHDFLKQHPDLSNRIIIVDDVNENTTLEGLKTIINTNEATNNESNFAIQLVTGIIIGIFIGIACGVFIMKKKELE